MYRKEIQEASKKHDFEVHRNYLDVQILLDGSEMWEYAVRADLADKDCLMIRKLVLSGFPGVETEFR